MKVKELKDMLKGLKGDMDIEFKMDYDNRCGTIMCKNMNLCFDTQMVKVDGKKLPKIVIKAILSGDDSN